MESKYEIGYKVLVNDHRKLLSFISSYKMNIFKNNAIQYRVGKWVSSNPGCGPLTVFSDLTLARNFLFRELPHIINYGMYLIIYQCKYIEVDLRYNIEKRLWITSGQSFEYLHWCDFPQGTKLASKIKLIKKVKTYE